MKKRDTPGNTLLGLSEHVLIAESTALLTHSIEAMLIRIGFHKARIHKASNVFTYKGLVAQRRFGLLFMGTLSAHYDTTQLTQWARKTAVQGLTDFVYLRHIPAPPRLRCDKSLEASLALPFNFIQFKALIMRLIWRRAWLERAQESLKNGEVGRAAFTLKGERRYQQSAVRVLLARAVRHGEHAWAIAFLVQLDWPTQAMKIWGLEQLALLYEDAGDTEQALLLASQYVSYAYPASQDIERLLTCHALPVDRLDRTLARLAKQARTHRQCHHYYLYCAYLCLVSRDYRRGLAYLECCDEAHLTTMPGKRTEYAELSLLLVACWRARQPKGPRLPRMPLKIRRHIQHVEQTGPRAWTVVLARLWQLNPVISPRTLTALFTRAKCPYRRLLILVVCVDIGCLETARALLVQYSPSDLACFERKVVEVMLAQLTFRLDDKQRQLDAEKAQTLPAWRRQAQLAPYQRKHHIQFLKALDSTPSPPAQTRAYYQQAQRSATILLLSLPNTPNKHQQQTHIRAMKQRIKAQLTGHVIEERQQ